MMIKTRHPRSFCDFLTVKLTATRRHPHSFEYIFPWIDSITTTIRSHLFFSIYVTFSTAESELLCLSSSSNHTSAEHRFPFSSHTIDSPLAHRYLIICSDSFWYLAVGLWVLRYHTSDGRLLCWEEQGWFFLRVKIED